MYSFLKIFIVLVLALVLVDRPARKKLDQYTRRPCWMGFSRYVALDEVIRKGGQAIVMPVTKPKFDCNVLTVCILPAFR